MTTDPFTRESTDRAPGAAAAADVHRWLVDTPTLQLMHPRIRMLVKGMAVQCATPADLAKACFDIVRNLRFTCTRNAALTAPEVLRRGCGDAFTKSTLFTSMLRSGGIPARIRALSLPGDVFEGLVPMTMATVDHVVSEVFIEGTWIGVDAYVPDGDYVAAARSDLNRHRKSAGFGLHVDGLFTWDARNDAFCHRSRTDLKTAPLVDWGAFNDVSEFLQLQIATQQETPRSASMHWDAQCLLANRRVTVLRRDAMLEEHPAAPLRMPVRASSSRS